MLATQRPQAPHSESTMQIEVQYPIDAPRPGGKQIAGENVA